MMLRSWRHSVPFHLHPSAQVGVSPSLRAAGCAQGFSALAGRAALAGLSAGGASLLLEHAAGRIDISEISVTSRVLRIGSPERSASRARCSRSGALVLMAFLENCRKLSRETVPRRKRC